MAQPKGFTLVEILITLGLFAVIAGLGLFVTISAYQASVTRSEREVVVSLLERARSRAMANVEQSAWGLCLRGSEYLLYKGRTCPSSGASDTEETTLGPGVEVSMLGSVEGVAFDQVSGNAASTTIRITQQGRVEEIFINAAGAIAW